MSDRRTRRNALVRWLVHRVYAVRGRRDGRRGLPLVSLAGGQPSPLLHRLGDDVVREVALLRALEVDDTVELRVSLAKLVGPAGERDREEQRLQHLLIRLQELQENDPDSVRRLGEEDLPEEFVQRRRRQEHERRVRSARKRVETQRTEVSKIAAKEHALRASLTEARRATEAQVRLVGAERKAEAAAYLHGALRTHPERPLLSALVPELAPRVPARPSTDEAKR